MESFSWKSQAIQLTAFHSAKTAFFTGRRTGAIIGVSSRHSDVCLPPPFCSEQTISRIDTTSPTQPVSIFSTSSISGSTTTTRSCPSTRLRKTQLPSVRHSTTRSLPIGSLLSGRLWRRWRTLRGILDSYIWRVWESWAVRGVSGLRPFFTASGLCSQLGTTGYPARRFRQLLTQWLRRVKALWPQGPAEIAPAGDRLILKSSRARPAITTLVKTPISVHADT